MGSSDGSAYPGKRKRATRKGFIPKKPQSAVLKAALVYLVPNPVTSYVQFKAQQMSKATERIQTEVPPYKSDRWWNRKHNAMVRFERELILIEEGVLQYP